MSADTESDQSNATQCWFCGTRQASEPHAYKRKFSGQSELGYEDMGWNVRGLLHGSGPGFQHVEKWREITLGFPRCVPCCKAHNRTRAFRILGFIVFLVLGDIFIPVYSINPLLKAGVLFVSGMAGLILGSWLAARLRPAGCQPLSHWIMHPAADKLGREGFH